MPTQQERKHETRSRLLAAAAAAFAAHGVEGASVDAIARTAGRTSGAIYASFGSKEGLLLDVLESWRSEVVASMADALVVAESLDDRLRALWRHFAAPTGPAREWVRLEHELWRWATRDGNETARDRLAARYRAVWANFGDLLVAWRCVGPSSAPQATAAVLVATLIGLEMQHRLDPDLVTEEVAVRALRAHLHESEATSSP